MKSVDPNAAFQAAEKAAAKGDWPGARRAYGRVLKSMPRDWRGFYRAGLLEARGQHFRFAENALERALSLAPDNAEIAANLAQVHLLAGNPARAVELLRPIARKAPKVPEIRHRIGLACQELGRLDEAEEAYREAMELGSRDPAVLNNRAVVLRALGRSMEAIALLETLKQRGDAGIETLNNLGNLYRVVGRNSDSAAIFTEALMRNPLNAHLHRNLALLNRDSGDSAAGIATARRAALCEPGAVDGLVIIAEMLEHRADLAEAERFVLRAICVSPENPDAVTLQARIQRRRGDNEKALDILRASPVINADRPGGHKLLFEAAQAEQALGRYDQAFATLVEANRRQIAATPTGRADPKRVFEQVRILGEMVDALDPGAFAPEGSPEADDAPVFLVGFPRSGTTLLDQVLDSHPSVAVLEERPLVSGMIARLRQAGQRYPQDLPYLDVSAVAGLRRGYLEDRDRYIPVPSGSVFVDKMPLNIVHAALIRRVFPKAPFLLALRDPRDICLSCFMQSFELNDWMAVFTDIEETARLFDAVFNLWRRTSAKLALDYHAVRYENLIGDLRGTASAAIRFLGLEWDDAMAEYHEHAKRRGHLATPSHSQVTQPVYSHAVQRWKRYGGAMEKTAKILEPSCIALGYGD
jgi:tetratricopeptide (TPR) repeat protein